VLYEQKSQENYGDILSKYLVEKISKSKVTLKHPKDNRWYHLNKVIYLGAGSIIMHADKNSIVWGSGIISKTDKIQDALFLSVRGPQTYQRIKALGFSCPPVFGDPAILLPKYYSPKIEKSFDLGIIPHYVDYDKIVAWYKDDASIKIINLLNDDIEDVTRQIMSCKRIISSSLHGVIVSHSYNIPCVWVKFSDKLFGDDVKFHDYLESVAIEPYAPYFFTDMLEVAAIEGLFDKFTHLPKTGIIAGKHFEGMSLHFVAQWWSGIDPLSCRCGKLYLVCITTAFCLEGWASREF
jgi:hypothetical protein